MTATRVSPDEVAALWERYKADPKNTDLRNKIVEIYIPLVKYHAQRVWSRLPDGVDIDDLTSSGIFGLIDG